MIVVFEEDTDAPPSAIPPVSPTLDVEFPKVVAAPPTALELARSPLPPIVTVPAVPPGATTKVPPDAAVE
jgi:hypothetical protein